MYLNDVFTDRARFEFGVEQGLAIGRRCFFEMAVHDAFCVDISERNKIKFPRYLGVNVYQTDLIVPYVDISFSWFQHDQDFTQWDSGDHIKDIFFAYPDAVNEFIEGLYFDFQSAWILEK